MEQNCLEMQKMILTDEMRRYYDKKIKCPVCHRKVVETEMTPPTPIEGKPYRDIINVVMCGECNWRGKVDQLRG